MPVVVFIAPVIPGLNDHEIPSILETVHHCVPPASDFARFGIYQRPNMRGGGPAPLSPFHQLASASNPASSVLSIRANASKR